MKRLLSMCIAIAICWSLFLPARATEALSAEMEEAIAQWKQELSSRYEHIPSLQISFSQNTEIVKDRYLRADLTCTLTHAGLSRPLELSRSFHASLHNGILLDLDDLLIIGGAERIQRELAEETGLTAVTSNWKLTENGLILYPCRGIGKGGLPLSEETLSRVLIWDGSVMWPNRPMLALTFDDGPSPKTPRLLNILAENHSRATFFVVGNMIGGRTEILRRMQDEGHEIGGHSWNHANLTELDSNSLYNQLSWTKHKIDEATGGSSCLMRPPYGASNGQVNSTAAGLGLSVVFWSVDTLDWLYLDAARVYDVIITQATDGSIVLCHDLYESTVDAIEQAIPVLLKQGYQLVTVSELYSR